MRDVSVQCAIGKCTVCPDANCEHHCHPRGGKSITELLLEEGELLVLDATPASETEN